jgi:hypothetical protein
MDTKTACKEPLDCLGCGNCAEDKAVKDCTTCRYRYKHPCVSCDDNHSKWVKGEVAE